MSPNKFGFDEREANALGRRTIDALTDLPASSAEILQPFLDRAIWDEMHAAGFLSAKQRQDITDDVGATLGSFLKVDASGNPSESLRYQLHMMHRKGPQMALKIGTFIRAVYGFDPEGLPSEGPWSFEADPDAPDVSALDTRLTDVLGTPLERSAFNCADKTWEKLSKNGISTVGDFLVLSQAELAKTIGIPTKTIAAMRATIAEVTGLDVSQLRGIALEAIRWKHTVSRTIHPNA